MEELVETFIHNCRQKGVPVTSQRIAIYRALAASREHPTAEDLFEQVRSQNPALSFGTVYKTLETFEKLGVVTRSRPTGEKARFDANPHPHHHLICRECGRIEDVPAGSVQDLHLPARPGSGFIVEDYRIDFRGLCPDCHASAG